MIYELARKHKCPFTFKLLVQIQDGSFGFLPMESSIDFLFAFFFFPLAAQSTSLKEAQEIFKSKQ